MRAWLVLNPRVLGAVFFLVALSMWKDGADDAKTYRRFVDASPVTAEVLSVSKKSSFPPRWNAEVKWRERSGSTRSATLVVGTRGKGWDTPRVSEGEQVEILITPDNPAEVIAAGSRSKTVPLRFLGSEFDTDDFWLGCFMALAGVFCFAFAGTIRREAEKTFGRH
jgi:hypothetical protein